MVWVRSPVYFYKRNETFYLSHATPSDLLHRFNKRKIEVSLRTKSEAKAAESAAALSFFGETHMGEPIEMSKFVSIILVLKLYEQHLLNRGRRARHLESSCNFEQNSCSL